MNTNKYNKSPIGVFDSGVGGLSVLREIRNELPNEALIYFADQAHVPYGQRSQQQLQVFAEGIVSYLIQHHGVKLVVVACNTASAAALHHLRNTFPEVVFIGMEPALKPAAEKTSSGVVGVLATPTTFEGKMYASVVARFAKGVTVLQDTCAGLVSQIELGNLNGDETRRILTKALNPMLAKGLDSVVLGCTHYPFVIPLIQEIVGSDVHVIDPAPAIAKQAARLLKEHQLSNHDGSDTNTRYITSGDADQMRAFIKKIFAQQVAVSRVSWHQDKIVEIN